MTRKKLFISHASEDKEAFVRPLVEELNKYHDVWYDEISIVVGLSLMDAINKGLETCDFGVVVLSPHFFSKSWPRAELDSLFTLHLSNGKILLPIWHNIDKSGIERFSPLMAGKLAVNSNQGVTYVVQELNRAIAYFDAGKVSQLPSTGYNHFAMLCNTLRANKASRSIGETREGEENAAETARRLMVLLHSHAEAMTTLNDNLLHCSKPNFEHYFWYINMTFDPLMLRIEYHHNVPCHTRGSNLIISISEETNSSDPRIPRCSEREKHIYVPYFATVSQIFWQDEDNPNNKYTSEQLLDDWLGKFAQTNQELLQAPQVTKRKRPTARVYRM